MAIHLESETPATIENASPGWLRLFIDGGSWKYKDENGNIFTLATGVTQEEVEDIVAAFINSNSSTISTNYDDAGNLLSIDVVQSALDHTQFQNIGTNTHAQIDNHIASQANPHAVTAAQVGADPAGTAASEVGSHVSDADPHPQYTTVPEAQALVNAHAGLTNNPHSVNAAQVGLGNVDNTSDADKPVSTAQDAADTAVQNFSIQRSNHIGTQTASTISDFENAVRQIYDKTTEQDNAEQVQTSNASFANRHNINKTPLHTDEYLIRVVYTWAYDDGGTNFEGELLVDGSIVRRHEQEPKDVGGADGGAGTDQRHAHIFEYVHSATASTPFNVVFQFRPEANGAEATVRDSVVTIERVLEV